MRKLIAFLISVVMLFGVVAFAEDWVCPSCGNKATGNFCNNCGMAATSVFWTCPQCGNEATGNFCNNCGAKKPEEEATAVTEAPQEENHEPVDESESTPAPEPELSREELLEQYWKVGNIITFGRYEQDDNSTNGPEEIEWIILDYDKANHKVFLLSKYGLDVVPYNTKFTRITWEKSSLRAWLNSDFLNKAFNAEEQSAILSTTVNNGTAQGYNKWNIDGGKSTQDQVYLLSYAEANHYLGLTYDKSSINAYAAATEYAIEQGACVSADYQTADGKGTTWWWLRSPGGKQGSAARVDFDGSLYSCNIDKDYNAVRPALWLDINSIEPTEMQYGELSNAEQNDNAVSKTVKAGDTLLFGRFEQDNNSGNGPEQIEWRVLAVEKGRALLVSKYCLDEMSYWDSSDVMAVERHGINWSTSYIRQWLNGEFYSKSFTADEKTRIPVSDVYTNDRSGKNTTKDRVFILSASEVEKYFSGVKDASAPVTEYARSRVDVSRGAVLDGVHGIWWLRDMMSIYKEADKYDFLSGEWNEAGYVCTDGLKQYREGNGIMITAPGLLTVRPAMWIYID